MNKVLMQSGKDDWETPQALFDELDREFHFTLDPCSTHENAKCAKHYTAEENGLQMSWGGGDRFLQSSIQQGRAARRVGAEVLRGSAKARNRGGCLAPGTNGHRPLPQIHTGQGGNSLHSRPPAL